MHAAKDDQAVAGCGDLVAVDLEARPQAECCDPALDQPLGGLRQGALRLANADRERAALALASLDQEFAEEMRFARTAAAIQAFVARRLEQRLKRFRCRYLQDGQ